MIRKVVKFGLVGFSGMIIDYGITILFKEFIGINAYIANSLGFSCAASSNYLLNRIWTFRSKNPRITREYITFILIAVAGLILNNFIVWLLSDYIFTLNFYLAKLVAIAMVFLWNFLMNHYFNFNADLFRQD